MRPWYPLCVAVLAFPVLAQDVIDVADHGRPQQFVTARDEIFTTAPDGRRQLEKIIGRASLADTKRTADTIRLARGGDAQIVLYEANRPRTEATRRILTRDALVVLDPGADVYSLAAQAGAVSFSPAPALTNAWIFHASDSAGALDIASVLAARGDVVHAEPLLARQQSKRAIINDPFSTNQWHLLNTGQNGGTAGVDVNITNVWSTYRGEGIRIGIVDDGLQYTHTDLFNNADTITDHDFNNNDADPAPDTTVDYHGTACAGLAAARGSNGIGVAGAAFRGTLVGLRLISAPTTDDTEAQALGYSNNVIFIKSNSWGPADDGVTLEGPGLLTQAAFANAAATGRGGKGTIFVWAGGNGGTTNAFDNSNKDGYANSIFTIAICAINDQGNRCDYSELGANLVVGTPSGDSDVGRQDITTTDLTGTSGYNNQLGLPDYSNRAYTKTFNGTSAACPLAAGAIALILQANTNLGWRDLQEILMRTATKNDASDPDWITNSAGFHFNHQYGAGLMNTRAAVSTALTWTNLAAQTSVTISKTNLNATIPDNDSVGVTQRFELANAGLRVEHVTVTLDIDHAFRGDVEVSLTSPSGTRSVMVSTNFDFLPDYKHWTFMSVRDWGESAAGTWVLRVADLSAGVTGVLNEATLKIFGTPAGGAAPLPVFVSAAATDTLGNANGFLDPGELIREFVVLRNAGATATNLALTLSTTHTQVFLLTNSAVLPLLGSTPATNSAPFVYRLAKSLPCGSTIPFDLTAAYPGGAVTVSFQHVLGATYTFGKATNTFESADVPKIITDGGTIFSTVVVAQAGSPVIEDVNVSIRINHTYDGDLQIAARHPDGTEIKLSNQNGYSNNNYGTGASCPSAVRTVFDDEAATLITLGTFPFAGSFKPEGSLSALDGKPVNGNWQLRVSDLFEADTGTTVCWAVTAVTHLETNGCTLFNNPPVASNISVTTTSPASMLIQLAAGDIDLDTLTFRTNAPPPGGTLSNFNASTGLVLYTPANGFCGTDTFTFAVSDGTVTSAPAAVKISVICPPAASNQLVSIRANASTNIILTGGDPDGDPFSFRTNAPPAHGVVSNFNPATGSISYAPTNDFCGTDTFTFAVSDGVFTSAPATVTIAVKCPPVASNQVVTLAANTSTNLILTGGSPGGDPLTFLTNAPPPFGTVSNFNANSGFIAYAPIPDFCGTDSFTFAASDGVATSAAATVTLIVTCPPDPDTDDDGVDDAWEQFYFGNLTNVTDTSDNDADGFSDVSEFNEGSVPTDATSLLSATTVTNDGTGFIVTWQSHSNRNYLLSRATNLVEGYIGIASNIPATPPANTYTDENAGAQQFYKVDGKNGTF